MSKETSRDLVTNLIELELEKNYLELQEREDDTVYNIEIVKIDKGIEEIKKSLANKASGIDHMILEMNKRRDLIDAEIGSLMKEVNRLRGRKNAIKRTEDYFNKNLIPMIIETAGNDNIFETKTTRYKLYKTWGPIEVINEDEVPDNYKRYKVEIDKKGARKEIIEAAENGQGIRGFKIEKVNRVRRS